MNLLKSRLWCSLFRAEQTFHHVKPREKNTSFNKTSKRIISWKTRAKKHLKMNPLSQGGCQRVSFFLANDNEGGKSDRPLSGCSPAIFFLGQAWAPCLYMHILKNIFPCLFLVCFPFNWRAKFFPGDYLLVQMDHKSVGIRYHTVPEITPSPWVELY